MLVLVDNFNVLQCFISEAKVSYFLDHLTTNDSANECFYYRVDVLLMMFFCFLFLFQDFYCFLASLKLFEET